MEKYIATYCKRGKIKYFEVDAYRISTAEFMAKRRVANEGVKLKTLCGGAAASKLVKCIERYDGEVTDVRINSETKSLEVYIKKEIVAHIKLD
jgi:hypothetical protein